MKRLIAGEPLTDQERGVIALFVGALHERTLGMLEHRQAFWDQLMGITRQMQEAHQLDSEEVSQASRDAFWDRFAEEAKRKIATGVSAFAQVTGVNAFIVKNESRLPLITSDSPVTYRQLHADELLAADMPPEWLYRDIPRSARHFFVFCPLSPAYAYLSSEFFPPNPQFLTRSTRSEALVFVLNELTRESAEEELFSSVPDPYGPWRALALAHEAKVHAHAAHPASGLSVYSAKERYWLSTTSQDHGHGDHVLTGRLTFRTQDMKTLRAMANDAEFKLIEIVEAGREAGGLREAWLKVVALDENTDSIIENGPFR